MLVEQIHHILDRKFLRVDAVNHAGGETLAHQVLGDAFADGFHRRTDDGKTAGHGLVFQPVQVGIHLEYLVQSTHLDIPGHVFKAFLSVSGEGLVAVQAFDVVHQVAGVTEILVHDAQVEFRPVFHIGVGLIGDPVQEVGQDILEVLDTRFGCGENVVAEVFDLAARVEEQAHLLLAIAVNR